MLFSKQPWKTCWVTLLTDGKWPRDMRYVLKEYLRSELCSVAKFSLGYHSERAVTLSNSEGGQYINIYILIDGIVLFLLWVDNFIYAYNVLWVNSSPAPLPSLQFLPHFPHNFLYSKKKNLLRLLSAPYACMRIWPYAATWVWPYASEVSILEKNNFFLPQQPSVINSSFSRGGPSQAHSLCTLVFWLVWGVVDPVHDVMAATSPCVQWSVTAGR